MSESSPEIAYCRSVVRGWERLRLWYNGILLPAGVAMMVRTFHLRGELLSAAGPGGAAEPFGSPEEMIAMAVVFGFVANICFCLGPYLEFGLTACGVPMTATRARWFVFGIGTLVSLGVIGAAWVHVEYRAVSPLIPTP